MEKGLLIKAEKLKGKMVISYLIYNTKCYIVSVSWNDIIQNIRRMAENGFAPPPP